MNRLTLAASLSLLAVPAVITLASIDPPFSARARQPGTVREAAGRAESVDELRLAGPAGLARLLDQYDRTRDDSLIPTIDAVAAQKDAAWSRLYWHTDLDAAKSRAVLEHKPILCLRLLGKLTDEYSCANSRYFRTVLYADPTVSTLLRERFVLVWQSERPVPVVTIDFGDGRVLKRTVTGNSVHYILTPDGDTVDAVPGLVDAASFASLLGEAADAALGSPDDRRAHILRSLARATADLAAAQAEPTRAVPPSTVTPTDVPDAAQAGKTAASKWRVEAPFAQSLSFTSTSVRPEATARDAMPLATGKFMVEGPLVDALNQPEDPDPPRVAPARQAAPLSASKTLVEIPLVTSVTPTSEPVIDGSSDTWSRIGKLRLSRTRLSRESIALMRSQNPALNTDPALLDRTIANFTRSLAQDTARNTLDLRPRVLRWIIESPEPISLEDLNRRVYAELFLTPRTDPWLGLVPDATYSALRNDGCSAAN